MVGAGRIYAVFSPRGGAGKTTLAVNIALQQAMDQPERTALFDLNLTFGHAAAMLGLTPETSLADVPAESLADFDRRTLGRFMASHGSGLQVLVAGTRPEEGEVVTAAHVRAALSTMKRQFSASIVDCGTSFDEPTIAGENSRRSSSETSNWRSPRNRTSPRSSAAPAPRSTSGVRSTSQRVCRIARTGTWLAPADVIVCKPLSLKRNLDVSSS